MDDEVRYVVYDVTMGEGTPPSAQRVAEQIGISREAVVESFHRLADERMLVLQPTGEILMAGPFSAVPTPFEVILGNYSSFANCIWDALGIPAMLGANATINTNCADCGERARIFVKDGEVAGSGFMHFLLPVRLWWTHIVYT